MKGYERFVFRVRALHPAGVESRLRHFPVVCEQTEVTFYRQELFRMTIIHIWLAEQNKFFSTAFV